MSPELVSAIASVGTFVVIGATAVAAVVQLRHLRANNQLEGLLSVLTDLEGERVNSWVTETQREMPKLLQDPDYVRSVLDNNFDRRVSWLQLGNAYERVGSLLKYHLIPEEAFLDVYYGRAMHAWEVMQPVISLIRTARGQGIWENFEYMYMRAKAFSECHSEGNYPARTPRAVIPPFHFPSEVEADTRPLEKVP
jgi:hypothetical protein